MLSTTPIITPTEDDSTEQDLISNIPGAYTEFTQQHKPKSLATAANFQTLPKLHHETPFQSHTALPPPGNDYDYDYDIDDDDFDRSSSYSHLTDEYHGDRDPRDYYGDLAMYASLHHHGDMQDIPRFHDKPSASRKGNQAKSPITAYPHADPHDSNLNYEMGDSQTLPMTESFADLLDPHAHSSDHSHEDAFGNSHTDRGFTYPPNMPAFNFSTINHSSSGFNSSSSNVQMNFVNGEPVFPRATSSTYNPEADAVSNLSSKSFVNQEYVMGGNQHKGNQAQPQYDAVYGPQVNPKSISDQLLDVFPKPFRQTEASSSSPSTSDTMEGQHEQAEDPTQPASRNTQSNSYPQRRGFRLSHETDILYNDASVRPVHTSVDSGPRRFSSTKRTQQSEPKRSSDAAPIEAAHRSFILNNDDVDPTPSIDSTSQESQDPTVNTQSSSPSYCHNGRRVHNNTLTPYPSVSDTTSMDVSSITSYDLR
ncbi:Schizosaccharomyces specific protein Mug147 [Schizosaccharomyces osmophilus]|uniref:Schizosaccharomyces specific protein Mug147 n=1 Tax=Schizosaccharomyces osmophilus TaxID=2545709 RepID=A0AAE9W8Z5_9SCHI|nr:Schizosaccharomyces specific protein Mug147 [Schizosaccharomyces osmophilus]WBW71548.1 Schizosaccharomyces specific protein Mug147 [Schizosaccharomyces osmophilus]